MATVYVVGLSERQALVWLSDNVQPDIAPILTTDELRRALLVAAISDANGNLPDQFDRWMGSTPYAIGEYVIPATRNGYVYVVTVAGQSGTTAPAFPTTLALTVVDGGVTWRAEDTAAWVPTYDKARLNKAASRCCYMKADKLGDGETFSGDNFSDHPEVRRDYWLRRAKEWTTGNIGTIDVQGRSARSLWEIEPTVILSS